MARATEEIANDIAQFQPKLENWLPLDDLVNELWTSGQPHKAIPQLLKIFERFPEGDGDGVFWSILHGIEAIEGYEPLLLQSVDRMPSDFGVILLGRLLNSGAKEIEGKPITDILGELTSSSAASASTKRRAHSFLERHNDPPC